MKKNILDAKTRTTAETNEFGIKSFCKSYRTTHKIHMML